MKLKKLLTNHTYEENELFLKEKIITLNIIMLFMGVVLFAFSALRFFEENFLQAAFDFGLFIIILIEPSEQTHKNHPKQLK
jgi:hypothetical protein